MRLPAFLLAASLTLAGCNDPVAMNAIAVAAQVLVNEGRLGASPAPGSSPTTSTPAATTGSPGLSLPEVLRPLPTGLSAGNPTADEQQLYDLIMAYRAEKGLPRIALSRSLTIVAQTHAGDLQAHPPDTDAGCNMHSWSANGPWTAVCYTAAHAEAKGMWGKPGELTRYKGNGYEIAYGAWGSDVTPAGALKGWQGSGGHNAVMVNLNSWSDNTWQAVGVGITANYAVTWFGEEPDPTP